MVVFDAVFTMVYLVGFSVVACDSCAKTSVSVVCRCMGVEILLKEGWFVFLAHFRHGRCSRVARLFFFFLVITVQYVQTTRLYVSLSVNRTGTARFAPLPRASPHTHLIATTF